MADDFGRQLADLLYGSNTAPEDKEEQPSRSLRSKLTGAAETAATLGSGILGSVPAGLAGLSQLLPTRGRAPSTNRAAQKVEDVQSALTYLPRTEAGQEYLEKTAGALGVLGIPAEFLGEQTLKLTGSPFLATVANVGLDPVNYIGIPGTGKALASSAKAMGRAAAAAPRVAGDILSSVGTGPTAGSRAAQLGAIKMKGGNWLAGEVEGATQSLKRETVPQELADEFGLGAGNRTQEALNNWIDKKLNRYIKNEMATPEDPVRRLAEQGILHYQPPAESRVIQANAQLHRGSKPPLGQNLIARQWEDVADAAIFPQLAEYQKAFGNIEKNPWLNKVDPETEVYGLSSGSRSLDQAGFDHLIDELKNAIDPNSDLPARLRYKPEDLEKVTMEQAVRRVHEINEYRAAKKAEANEVLARNPATFTFKEYPTVPGSDKPNEKGLAWKEIKQPGELPEGWVERGGNVAGPEGAVAIKGSVNDPRRKALEEALKYEGEVMGHCVGGYCDDVLSGRSQIYSLRDKKGEPHVTIEVEKMPRRGFREGEGPKTPEEQFDLQTEWLNGVESGRIGQDVTFAEWWRSKNGIPEPGPEFQITQIKGKANRAPKEEYLPFVQDFVRSGNWSRVGDFQNTGLRDMERTPNLREWLRSKGIETPRYVTEQEYGKYEGDFVLDRLGKKEGGSVHISDNPDTMRLELAGGGAVAAAKAAAKAAARSVEPSIVRPGNPIQGAVVLIGDQMFLGRTHADALNRAIYEGVVRKENNRLVFPPGAEVDSDLFMTKDGRVIDRLTAFKEMDIGASESAIEKGLMQNAPARSMSVDSYMDQARALRDKALQPAVSKQAGGVIRAAAKAVKPSAEQAAKLAESRAYAALKDRAYRELEEEVSQMARPPKGWGSAENVAKRIEEIKSRESGVLPAAERDANLARMLEASQVKSPLYHSSRSPDIDTFYSWSHLGTKKAAEDRARQIMQTNPEGVTTYPVHALVKNPLRTEDLGLNQMGFWNLEKLIDNLDPRKVDFSKWSGGKKGLKADYATDQDPSIVEDFLRRNGYDSIVYRNQAEDPGSDSYIIFNPKNIKSATGNRGTFDVTRPEITKKRGGTVKFTDNLDTMRLAVQKRK